MNSPLRFLNRKSLILILASALALILLEPNQALGAGGAESQLVLTVLLGLIVILVAAKLGGDLFERFGQPSVLGELVFGVILGNLSLIGIDAFGGFTENITLTVLAEVGVIILLFQVGLESTVGDMMRVGPTALLVALLGVITPFFLGWGVGALFLPDESIFVHIFLGATLTATSVGITARVLKDIHKLASKEGRIILGAAVIDDILGLIVLTVVAGTISAAATGGSLGSVDVLWIIAKAVLFVGGAILLGHFVLEPYFKLGFAMKVQGVALSFALLVAFSLSYLAGKIGLAPIVGAFAAGLILDDVHFRDFQSRDHKTIHELVEPIAIFLVPIFFVRMGMLVDLRTFGDVSVLGFAAVLTVAAIIGKQACSLAVWDKTVNRFAVGLGMIPRGEVGLIFAGIGAQLMYNNHPVVSSETYSAVVIMVILTTLATPPLLKLSLLRGTKRALSLDQTAE